MRFRTLSIALAALSAAPLIAPSARAEDVKKVWFAPDRTYDLLDVDVTTRVDADGVAFEGFTVNRLRTLRQGANPLLFHVGSKVQVTRATIDGRPVPFQRTEAGVIVTPSRRPRGTGLVVAFGYQSGGKSGFGDGFHWLKPQLSQPFKAGFWTQGETETNRDWMVTWDYPNDFATSTTRTTVPAAWTVIGNGRPVRDVPSKDGKSRTVVWRMDQPHATYLISLVAGPMAVMKAVHQGLPLWYAVPKGFEETLAPSFLDTPKMLDAFAKLTGTPYPWPKYAQSAMFEFGGGMENVSATTMGLDDLSDGRRGFWPSSSLNSHELGHQWFGDLVSCRDWGEIWLNESFATFLQFDYFRTAYGEAAYQQELQAAENDYFREAARYIRPVSTNVYANPDSVFDSHAYPKGGFLLHGLRRALGEDVFSAGLKEYLHNNRYRPVETSDLERAMTVTSGTNLKPWFDDWVRKPGHPILRAEWKYDEAARRLTGTLRQTQPTEKGVPIYRLKVELVAMDGDQVRSFRVPTTSAEATFSLELPFRPTVVQIDPSRETLRDAPVPVDSEPEALAVFRHSPWAPDRERALRTLAKSTDPSIRRELLEAISRDLSPTPAFRDASSLAEGNHRELKSFWISELKHPNETRQAVAVRALGALGPDEIVLGLYRGLISPETAYAPLREIARTLGEWDAIKYRGDLVKLAGLPGRYGVARNSALTALLAKGDPASRKAVLNLAIAASTTWARRDAIIALGSSELTVPERASIVRPILLSRDPWLVSAVAEAAFTGSWKEQFAAIRQVASELKDTTLPKTATERLKS